MRRMKDSGVEWIGEIPENWNVISIRAVFKQVTQKNSNGIKYQPLKFTYGSIVRKDDFATQEDQIEYLGYAVVEPGTIMINGLNLNFDFISQRVGLVREKGIITSAYLAIEPINPLETNSTFATYLLKAYDGCKAFHNMGSGIRKTLNFRELKRNLFLYPNIMEQNTIAAYLDEKCSAIDSVTAKLRSSIEKLKEYRLSLITEAVTKGLDPGAPMKDSGVEWIGEIPEGV